MSVRAGLLLAVLAAPARAGVVSFDAGPAKDAIFSGDGYHVAHLEGDESEDRWIVDGRVRARGPAGTLPGAGTLSADGRGLLHLVSVFDKDGKPLGVSAALNGHRVGAAYAEIQSLTLSPGGGNAGFAAKTPAGWSVVSGQGIGPAFPDPPALLLVSESGTLYFEVWKGAFWLYRDHKAIKRVAGEEVSASADLSRVGAVVKDAAGIFIDVDGVRYGPYASASVPAFSRGGRHWASLAAPPGVEPGQYTMIVADGKPQTAEPCSNCSLLVDDAGRAFEDVVHMQITEHGKMNTFYLNGRHLSKVEGPPNVGLLAGGGHFVYPMLGPRGAVVGYDGEELPNEHGVPVPLPNTPIEFDGDGEYHYWSLWGSSLHLNCGSLDGSDPQNTRCARKAGAVFEPVK